MLVLSVTAVTVTLSDRASAAVNSDTLQVTDGKVTASDDTITVEGTVDSDSPDTVTFRIVDSDGNRDFVKKSASDTGTSFTSTSFTAEIDLKNDLKESLSEGEVTIYVDHRDGYISSDDSTTFTVDDTDPEADIDSVPEPTSAPTVTGNITDENPDTVSVAIRNSTTDDYYKSDGSTSSSKQWLDASVSSGDWSYDTSKLGLADGEYEVYVKATDKAGTSVSFFDGPTYTHLEESFTLDTTTPSVNDVWVTDTTDGDGTVVVGDTVTVTANVTDETSGVDAVTVDAADLGGGSSLSLAPASGTNYSAEFTVSDPEVGEGTQTLTVTATDNHGQSSTDDSGSIDLETSIGSVGDLTIHQDFIGIVSDENTSVRVTASGINDTQGNTIVSEDTTLTVGDHRYDVTVSNGGFERTINPEDISNATATGEVSVELAPAGSGPYSDTVELVHDANNLQEGYQIEGTPMDAERVLLQHTDSEMTYDPTTDSFDYDPDLTTAGSAYYIHGINDTARAGYVFSDSSEARTRHLHEGYNLVTATPDPTNRSELTVPQELGSISVGNNDEVYVPKDVASPVSNPNNVTYTELSGNMEAYQGYYIYIDAGEEYGVITDEQYDP